MTRRFALGRGMLGRLVVAAVACGIVGFVIAPLVLRVVARDRVARFGRPLLARVYDASERQRCERDPEAWSIDFGEGARAFAYDGVTLASRNPDAPRIDRIAWTHLVRSGETFAAEAREMSRAAGPVMLFRAAETGSCAVLQTTWPPRSSRADVPAMLAIGLIAAAAAAAAVALFALVRPLERAESRHGELRRHIGDVSHDLKTPIASLHLALEQALAVDHDPGTHTLLAGALGDAVYLAALTDNLRLASEMRDGWNPAASAIAVDLCQVVNRVVSRARFLARQRGVELEASVPDDAVRVACDPLAAEQAVSNVVENAVTHGEAGTHVAVLLDRSAEAFVLTVSDDGPNLVPAELPRLGERTFRSDAARQRDPRGSGLGLAITHEVCARCGLELTFGAEVPRGLRVTIRGKHLGSRAGPGPVPTAS